MRRNRLLLIGGGIVGAAALAVAAIFIVFALRSDDPHLKTSAPEIPTSAAADAVTPGPTTTPAASTGTTPGTLHFVVNQSGSEAKYVVSETLRGIANSKAVGTTNAVTGDFYLTTSGLASSPQTKLTVDLTKLKTDESMRDNYVRDNVLQTRQFPNAEFVATSVTPWPANYTDGTEVALTLAGKLTIHGVSKDVQWTVKARRAGDMLSGIADIDFNMTDFNIQPPDVQIAKAQNGVHLQMTVLAKLAA